jgi:hypothetical protein
MRRFAATCGILVWAFSATGASALNQLILEPLAPDPAASSIHLRIRMDFTETTLGGGVEVVFDTERLLFDGLVFDPGLGDNVELAAALVDHHQAGRRAARLAPEAEEAQSLLQLRDVCRALSRLLAEQGIDAPVSVERDADRRLGECQKATDPRRPAVWCRPQALAGRHASATRQGTSAVRVR